MGFFPIFEKVNIIFVFFSHLFLYDKFFSDFNSTFSFCFSRLNVRLQQRQFRQRRQYHRLREDDLQQ